MVRQSRCGRAVERRDAVSGAQAGAPLARRLGHERDVHVRALDAGALEARRRRGRSRRREAVRPGRAGQGRERGDAGLEHREVAQAAHGVRDVDRAQVAHDDLVAAVVR